jgi:hypothetical protein
MAMDGQDDVGVDVARWRHDNECGKWHVKWYGTLLVMIFNHALQEAVKKLSV